MVKSLYIVGGRQRSPRSVRQLDPVWQGYDGGLVLRVDTESAEVSTCLEYVSPDEVIGGADAAISLQASSLDDTRLYTCTETEVMVYQMPGFERELYLSLPWFNDVHHVCPSPSGTIVVANAGLEMVVEITPTGEVVRAWNVLGEEPWAGVDPELDYRKLSTKPHRAHPNYVFFVDSDLWTTRFHQGDAVCLTGPGKSIAISEQRIHDGVLCDGKLYFTTVDGKIVVADPEALRVVEVIDLTRLHDDRTLLGWCRGVLVEDNHMWVGFSRIRPTQFRENVSWIARGFRRGKPTHIACYDLGRRECVTEIDLEPAELSALYSILPAEQA